MRVAPSLYNLKFFQQQAADGLWSSVSDKNKILLPVLWFLAHHSVLWKEVQRPKNTNHT